MWGGPSETEKGEIICLNEVLGEIVKPIESGMGGKETKRKIEQCNIGKR